MFITFFDIQISKEDVYNVLWYPWVTASTSLLFLLLSLLFFIFFAFAEDTSEEAMLLLIFVWLSGNWRFGTIFECGGLGRMGCMGWSRPIWKGAGFRVRTSLSWRTVTLWVNMFLLVAAVPTVATTVICRRTTYAMSTYLWPVAMALKCKKQIPVYQNRKHTV